MTRDDTSALRALQEVAQLEGLPIGSVILDIGVINAPVICCKAADGLWHVTGTPNDRRWNHFEIIRDSVEQGNRLIVAYDPSRDPDLLDAMEEAHKRERAFSYALGFGDDVTEPAASLDELIEPIQQAFQDSHEHVECPKYCELCGGRFADVRCVKCSGSGCLPNAQLAYLECDECAGSGWIHEGCTQMSYEDMAAQLAAPDLLNELDQVRGLVAELRSLQYFSNHADGDDFVLKDELDLALDRYEALAIPAEPAGVSHESIEQVRWAEANPGSMALDEVEANRRDAAEGGE